MKWFCHYNRAEIGHPIECGADASCSCAGYPQPIDDRSAEAPDRIKALLTQVETLTRERDEACDLADTRLDLLWKDQLTDDEAAEVRQDYAAKLIARAKVASEANKALEARALTAEAERDDLRTQLRAAHKALEPFAEAAAAYDPPEDDDREHLWFGASIRIGHLRRAREARSLLHTEKTSTKEKGDE